MHHKPTGRAATFVALLFAAIVSLTLGGCGGGGGSSVSTGPGSAPSIASFEPTSGPSGTSVTITGANFGITRAIRVKINGVDVPVTDVTPTSVTVNITSIASTGTISVQVAGETATSADSFIVTAGVPTITSFSPNSGQVGTTVLITGTHFSTTPTDNTVWLNGSKVIVKASTETSITITVPSVAQTGPVSLQTKGGMATSADSFTAIPTISSFSPTSGAPGSLVTIAGNNFSKTNLVTLYSDIYSNYIALQVTEISPTSIKFVVPPAGKFNSANIYVQYDPYPLVASSATPFLMNNAPVIHSFSPSNATAGANLVIYADNIAGPSFTANKVTVGGVNFPVNNLSYQGAANNNFIRVTVPAGFDGLSGPITVTKADGTATTNESFYIQNTPPPPPKNTLSINPSLISFGSIATGSYSFRSVNVTNTGTVNLHVTGAAVSGSNVEYRGTNCYGYNYLLQYYDTLSPGASCTVDVAFAPTATATSTGTLSIASTAVGSPHTVSLSGTGVNPLAPVVSLSPTSLTFAASELGTSSAAQIVTLRNTGTAVLNISGISVGGEYIQANTCPTSLAAGASCTISVTFTPVRLVGSKLGAVGISSNAPDSPHEVKLSGVGSLSRSGRLAIFTRQSWGVQNVFVDSAWVGGSLKYDSQNICGGIGTITLTLAPGTHTIEANDPVLSISPATVTVTDGGCTVHQITGTSTCLSPNFISNGGCYTPSSPLTCTSPQVMQNGVCVTPGASAGTGSGSAGTGGTGTNGGVAGTFDNSGIGTNATNCLSFGLATGAAASYNDTQTITNNCGFPVYVLRCHSPTTLPGTADTECNAAGSGRFYQQFHWLKPGDVKMNSYSLPPGTTIWYGACSGGRDPSLPSGAQVGTAGRYVCN